VLIWLALAALAAVLAALAGLMLSPLLSALTGVLRLLARFMLSAALLLPGLLLATLLMLRIVGLSQCDRPAAVMWKTQPPQEV
jgi:hypothetical protein